MIGKYFVAQARDSFHCKVRATQSSFNYVNTVFMVPANAPDSLEPAKSVPISIVWLHLGPQPPNAQAQRPRLPHATC
jgi:hypothetical protein